MDDIFSPANLLDHMSTGIIVVDQEDRVKRINSAAERLLGRPRCKLLGVLLQELLPGHPVAVDLIQRARKLSMACRARQARLSPGPNVNLTVSLTATPLISPEGVVQGVILQLEEMGNAKRLEEGDRLHDTLDSMSSLALSVAHEVKNPLTGIRGAAQLLEMESTSESATACTTLIRTEVDRVSRLLDSLLGLADTRPLEEGEFNIHEVLDHVLNLAMQEGPPPRRDYDPSLPEIRGDRDQLIQLFLNLVQNALEATSGMGEGRRIVINTRISSQVRLEQGRRNLHVVVEVVDNGPGVPAELRKRIFLPFVSTKTKGGGLGLPICQKIVHDHAGQIELNSVPGETRFRIDLPLPQIT